MTQSSPVESVDRALLVLQELSEAGAHGATLAELTTKLRLNKTTVHRALGALRFRDYVAQDPASGRYLLGPAAMALADSMFSIDALPVVIHPALSALSTAVGELVHLGVLSGTNIMYLDKVEPERSVRVWSAVGRRNPAVRTALGRAILAFRGTDRAALAGYLAAGYDPAPAEGTGQGTTSASSAEATQSGAVAAGADHVWQALEWARARGFASEQQENEPDISCIAVPLLRNGAAIAAVSITAPAERMSPDRMQELHDIICAVLPPLLPASLSLPH